MPNPLSSPRRNRKNFRLIQVSNRYNSLIFDEGGVCSLFHFLDTHEGGFEIPQGELSIVFLNAGEITRLHTRFLGHSSPTDVITFPGSENKGLDFAGEICVSVDYAIHSSAKLHIAFPHELTLYLVHGWLHLAGLKDDSLLHRQEMRDAEAEIMKKLEQSGKIPVFKVA